MKSRGFLYSLGDGTRRSLALFWALLLVSSLLLQYASLAAPQPALAVHNEGLFELDGNAVSGAAIDGDDWDKVYDGSSSASSTKFITDPVDDNADDSFTGGSTKDDLALGGWLWKAAKASQAKNDITNAFAAAYGKDGDTIAYFGLNKWEADGDNFVGFWFFKDAVGTTGAGDPPGSPFSGSHSVGDILILADYTNGGSVASFNVYKWVGSGGNVNGTLQTVATGIECGGGGNDDACGTTNGGTVSSPWPFDGRDGAPGEFPAGTFFEGGLNLTSLGLDSGCFTSFLAETRSSQSVDATLSDFALGRFSFCVAPDIKTQVQQDGTDVQTINKGESVTDHATLTGTKGVVQGTVKFFVCGPDTSGKPDCTNGGDKVGATKTLSGGEADSDPFTPTALGSYCFRVEYTAAAGSKYVDSTHTNQSSSASGSSRPTSRSTRRPARAP